MQSIWTIKKINGDLTPLVKRTGIDPLFIKILINRGIKDEKDILKFFKGDLDSLYEPYLMKDMEKGISIIKNAIERDRYIAVYGDYDVDGVSSTVILYKGLKRCGAKVKYHVPDREDEGYGMSIERIKKLKEEGVEVIITCDNGISALEEVKYAVGLGMEVVVTDHHQPPFNQLENGEKEYVLPNAHAVINPNRRDCEYPFKLLCGAAISYKFIQALYRLFNINNNETYELLQYAAIASVCDVVDLIDENRIIVKEGLKLINKTESIGLKALLKSIGILDKEVKAYNIGFQIGPCINATGRLETAALAIELFLCEDEKKAESLANNLYELNKKRKDMTSENVEAIIKELNLKTDSTDKVIVIYRKEVHESIAGIVAGRVKEHFNLPTIVLTDGKEMPKGSARSIEEYNMFEELFKCKDLLHKFGGHPMAAGLSIEEENIDKLRETLNANCSLEENDIMPKVKLDSTLPRNFNNSKFMAYLEILEPYGKGNSKPLFGEKNIEVLKLNLIGKNKNVLKMNLKVGYDILSAIMFNNIDSFMESIRRNYGEDILQSLLNQEVRGVYMDFVFYLDINNFLGKKSVQLIIKDFRIEK
ncbi:single-stranded-DNA-specific exonuclease RecJ [Hathewaya histolytica]|uniref:single-stranded-DNA-specific exonuclease RecJ n=1 Tax=Hathewaya histolytica TaxID=1498 RepID=UPI003B66F19B